MGDNPDPIPNTHECPDSFWDDGLQPEAITFNFSGIEKSDLWTPALPPPPNGSCAAAFVTCNLYETLFQDFNMRFHVGTTGSCSVDISIYGMYVAFDWAGLTVNMLSGSNLVPPGLWFTGGSFTANLGKAGGSLPASWDLAPLFGVPQVRPYKAEEQSTTQFSRMCRYAAHRDGTNIVIGMT